MGKGEIKYAHELDALCDNRLKNDPAFQKAFREFVEQRKRDINQDCERAGLPKPYLLDGEERIMSWSVTGEVTKENAVDEIMNLKATHDLGEGASYQFIKAKEYACDIIAGGVVRGEKFGVSLSGHSQADSPGSATDSIYISISART